MGKSRYGGGRPERHDRFGSRFRHPEIATGLLENWKLAVGCERQSKRG